MADRPLVGVRVLELAGGIAGPYGGKLLADLGADVVKAEPPTGDPARRRGPFRDHQPDPEASGFYLYLNAGKRGITLDLEQAAGRVALLDLVAEVDVLVESYRPGELDRLGVGVAALQERNPKLAVVSVTPFGQWGPLAGWLGNDLIAFHSSGFAYGFPSREIERADLPPLNAPSHAAAFLAGEMVAGAAVHGLLIAQRDGVGSHLDVSQQEAVAAENQSQHNALDRKQGERGGFDGGNGGVRREVVTASANSTVSFLPCKDGWVVISPREEHQWLRWLEVMGNPAWADDPRFATRALRQEHWLELHPLLCAWSRQQAKRDVFEAAQSRRVACYPLGTATDMLELPQFEHRGFFVEQEHPTLGALTFPGVSYTMADVARPRPGLAPRLGEHNQEIYGNRLSYDAARIAEVTGCASGRNELRPDERCIIPVGAQFIAPAADARTARTAPAAAARVGIGGDPAKPLAGVRVVDFSWVMAGPICTKYLAAMGAEVIKIESRTRPDLSHRNASWEELNPSKRSITLNLKEERARELVRDLIRVSDIVIENFSTGVMERLGLGYPALKELSPRIVMASASGFGRSGPQRDLVAYGSLLQCFTGWAALSAYPDRDPTSSGGIWTDPLTACLEAFLLLSAIWRQRRTGEGCFYDLSMSETMIAALPEPILAWGMNQTVLEARGNRDPLVAPQGCYPAAGDDRWLALSVLDDSAWPELCAIIGRPDLAADPGLATATGRRTRHDELNAAISAWTRTQDAFEASKTLQTAGVAATPTLTALDVVADEHLAARSFVSEIERLEGGTRHTLGAPWMIDGERPNRFRRAPRVGEDSEYVFKSLLGLPDETYDELVREQVIY
ncbi:MAG TPA: CoA transferase [Chloroflexota bacterium]|nr:CoA transferase [Chloroflexota bacterium]